MLKTKDARLGKISQSVFNFFQINFDVTYFGLDQKNKIEAIRPKSLPEVFLFSFKD